MAPKTGHIGIGIRDTSHGIGQVWVQILLQLVGCVTSGNWLTLSEPLFPRLQMQITPMINSDVLFIGKASSLWLAALSNESFSSIGFPFSYTHRS